MMLKILYHHQIKQMNIYFYTLNTCVDILSIFSKTLNIKGKKKKFGNTLQ